MRTPVISLLTDFGAADHYVAAMKGVILDICPKVHLVDTIVVDKQLLGKPFMPGGTLAQYKKGQTEFEMFVARTASPTEAALILPDWKKVLADSKYVPSFGGYYGHDAGRPIFVFTKGAWIAGIAGLPEKDADAEARKLAKALD